MLLTRPEYHMLECKRLLSGSHNFLARAAAAVTFSVVNVPVDGPTTPPPNPITPSQCTPPRNTPPPKRQCRSGNASVPAASRRSAGGASSDTETSNEPTELANIGNTCFMNSLVQCCRQLFVELSSAYPEQWGTFETDQLCAECPLASVLKEDVLPRDWGDGVIFPSGHSETLVMYCRNCLVQPARCMHRVAVTSARGLCFNG